MFTGIVTDLGTVREVLPIGAGPILIPLVDGTIVLGEMKYR